MEPASAPQQGLRPPRKIIHVDMDAFFASVEQRDDPSLRGKPVAVGFGAARGVVAAASYEARRFGVHSAMPSITAQRKCPELIFVRPRFEAYRAVSRETHAIFAEHTTLIEPLSLDEAYLDVTENHQGIPLASDIARRIREKIRSDIGITASAGISYNKFLAKMASGQRKPDGQFVIPPQAGAAFVETLPVGKFHGIGPATARKMAALDIHDGADLRDCTLAFLTDHFGKAGPYFYWLSRGVDERPVQPERGRKSVGAEDTFSEDLFTLDSAVEGLAPLIGKVWAHCQRHALRGRSVTLKVKFSDFRLMTRSRTLPRPFPAQEPFAETTLSLLRPLFPVEKGVRLLGVTLSGFQRDDEVQDLQFDLFDP